MLYVQRTTFLKCLAYAAYRVARAASIQLATRVERKSREEAEQVRRVLQLQSCVLSLAEQVVRPSEHRPGHLECVRMKQSARSQCSLHFLHVLCLLCNM
jgi:hypothetical protein